MPVVADAERRSKNMFSHSNSEGLARMRGGTDLYAIRHGRHSVQDLLARDDIPQPMSGDLVTLAETPHGNNMPPPIRPLEQPMRSPRLSSVLSVRRAYEISISLVHK